MSNKGKWIDRSLIVSPVRVCVCVNDEQFQAELKRMKVSTACDFPAPGTGCTLTLASAENQQCCIVCLNAGNDDGCHTAYGLIVHEVTHLWRAIRDAMNETNPGEEIEAYAQQMLFQRIAVTFDELTKA